MLESTNSLSNRYICIPAYSRKLAMKKVLSAEHSILKNTI